MPKRPALRFRLDVAPTDSKDFLLAAQSNWTKNTSAVLKALVNGNKGLTLYWRADTITDFRDERTPTAAVRLVRWDQLHPSIAFASGFSALQNDPTNASTNYSLSAAKLDKTASPFVFATSCFADRDSQEITRWKPFAYETLARRASLFEYEVYAYGGLLVDRSFPLQLGGATSNLRKGDVAFLGGIRQQFIRSATEYDESGRLVRYWINGNFDIGANYWANSHKPAVTSLPPHLFPPDLPRVVWTRVQVREDAKNLSAPIGDAMATFDGNRQSISIGDAYNRPFARAAVLIPGKSDEGYFFTDTRFVQFKYNRTTSRFEAVEPAENIINSWPSLDQLGFATVDGILPVDADNVRFFSGREQALVNIQSQEVAQGDVGAANIVVASDSLRKAGFSTIDAVFAPKNGQAYFFRGTMCVVVDTVNDRVLEGPLLITCRFPALADVGFTGIDGFVPAPDDTDEVFVFSGTDYIRATNSLEVVKLGPQKVDDTYWKALTDSGFY